MPAGAEPVLRHELLRRRERDQWLIKRARPGTEFDPALMAQIQATTHENVEWLKGIVRVHGWPGRSLVGDDGADAAWLIAQHADHDPTFQRECLDLVEEAVSHGEASRSNLAYLTDRVLLKEQGRQRYGTQFTVGANGPEPFPLEDPEQVDDLRSSVGLEPLDEYRKGFPAG